MDKFISNILSQCPDDQVRINKDCTWIVVKEQATQKFTLDMFFYDLTIDRDDTIVIDDDSIVDNEDINIISDSQGSKKLSSDQGALTIEPEGCETVNNRMIISNQLSSDQQSTMRSETTNSIIDIISDNQVSSQLSSDQEALSIETTGSKANEIVNNQIIRSPPRQPLGRSCAELASNIQNQQSKQPNISNGMINTDKRKTVATHPSNKENMTDNVDQSICSICDRGFETLRGLNAHIRMTHKKRRAQKI